MKCQVLDKGYIELLDSLGDDLTIVNAARISFDKEKKELDENDIKLLKYLIKNKHFSPFRHVQFQLKIYAPEFVLRQMFKHNVGIEATSLYPTKDTPWNEQSLRYTRATDFHRPYSWRRQSLDNKQSSEGILDLANQLRATEIYNGIINQINNAYNQLLNLGIAREQARILLPLGTYTKVIWTASFQALMNFIMLRNHQHAQFEIQEYARAIEKITRKITPKASELWIKYYKD